MLYSEHDLVAMCTEFNAGLGGPSIPPYRLLLIFSLRADHKARSALICEHAVSTI